MIFVDVANGRIEDRENGMLIHTSFALLVTNQYKGERKCHIFWNSPLKAIMLSTLFFNA